MITEKKSIEQLKRDLKSYGYYTDLKTETEIYLYNLRKEIQNCEEVSGIKYREVTSVTKQRLTRKESLQLTEASLEVLVKEIEFDIKRLGLTKGLTKMNDDQLRLIKLSAYKGKTNEEIGKIVGYSESNVRKRLKRIYKNLLLNSTKSTNSYHDLVL